MGLMFPKDPIFHVAYFPSFHYTNPPNPPPEARYADAQVDSRV